jgi:hypothetical protein
MTTSPQGILDGLVQDPLPAGRILPHCDCCIFWP